MIDYQGIIENLKDNEVIRLMEELGADRYEDKDSYIIFPTICHNEFSDEASMKLYYYKDNHFFYCYTECGGMSIFKFLEHYYNVRNIDYDWYSDIYQVIINCSTFRPVNNKPKLNATNKRELYKKRESIELEEYDKSVLDTFIKMYPVEWLEDGISKEAMDKFNILYSISQNKIIIPHYDIDGRLVGIRGRALNKWEVENVGKYMPVKIEQTIYKHRLSFNLYGLHQNRWDIMREGVCYLFESEKSVLQMESFNMPKCGLAVCGSNFNIFQLKLLMQTCHPKEIVICFDSEELPHEEKYFNKLYKIAKKYEKYCKISFIYDRENRLELKDSPTDKGELVFRQLLERRVQI